MRILNLKVKNYKNLVDFSIDFEEDYKPVLLIGKNGSGKTNLYEAIVEIFISIDNDKMASFDYEITYICNGFKVCFSQFNRRRSASIDNKKVPISKITNYEEETFRKKYIPKRVLVYYSGQSDRLKKFFKQTEENFKKILLKANKQDEKQRREETNQSLRRFIYTENIYSKFILLAFLIFDDERAEKLIEKYTEIEDIELVEFVLKKPSWKGRKTGESRFWNAAGVVADYLSDMANIAILMEDKKDIKRYLFKSKEDIRKFASDYGDVEELFKVIESIYISELLQNITVIINMKNGTKIKFDELSEGEQQLLTVLGMLRFVGDDESLFLLDEPETHLNPAWKYEYMNLLVENMGEYKSSHIIITTHDPLLVSGLEKEQVKIILKKDDGTSCVVEPEISPKGLGIEGVLTSELFGLRSALDIETVRELDEKRKLYIKSLNQTISDTEKITMRNLYSKLSNLEFTRTTLDVMYDDFVRAMIKAEEFFKPVLTPEEVKKKDEFALEIVKKLLKKDEK